MDLEGAHHPRHHQSPPHPHPRHRHHHPRLRHPRHHPRRHHHQNRLARLPLPCRTQNHFKVSWREGEGMMLASEIVR
jgi:hypothetical protein